jgi:hypothetical protein
MCSNGYGMAGLKLLRPMFEATVTARYLRMNPAETPLFLEYHHVHQRKFLKLAEQNGVDLSDRVSATQRDEIEADYQRVRQHYRQVVCDDCGGERELASWTKKDMVTMAKEVGLGSAVLYLYFVPTLQIHSTAARLVSRLEDTATAMAFRSGPQRSNADAAIASAHICLAIVLEDQNQCFGLGFDEADLRQDVAQAWPSRREGP